MARISLDPPRTPALPARRVVRPPHVRRDPDPLPAMAHNMRVLITDLGSRCRWPGGSGSTPRSRPWPSDGLGR